MSQTIKLAITGMTCDHCVHAVTTAVEDIEGVQAAKVELATNSAVVTGEKLDLDKILAAIVEEGYEATAVS
jgi:copper chaperone